jgi:hypothetical protein
MKQPLLILATLAALAFPAAVATAEDNATLDREWVDPAALANLLVEKGLITPAEQERLKEPAQPPQVDEETLEEVFERESYRGDS